MAFVVQNAGNKPSKKLGFIFEDKLCDHLRVKLPPSYAILPSAIVDHHPGYDGRRPGPVRPREVDLLVAGPNGLFLIEAKCKSFVRGSFSGAWAFSDKAEGGKLAEGTDGEHYGTKMKSNMHATHGRIASRGGRRFDAFKFAHGIFVFPDEAQINIYDKDGKAAWDFYGEFFVRRFAEVPELILNRRPPSGQGGGDRGPSPDDARALLGLFEPGLRLDPSISGDYKILHRGPYQQAPNGLPYTVCKLQHASMDYIRRGKWYDMRALGEKDRSLFRAQIQRHARVLEAAAGHRNVHRYYEFITDLVGDGYWVIEEWIDGATLDRVLAKGAVGPSIAPVPFMRDVAAGLQAIHTGGFVCRSLSPTSIIVDRGDGAGPVRPVLTNFEMAKAADGGPTVTAGVELPTDPFRAPEIRVSGAAAGDTDGRADVYSWGAIFTALVGGDVDRANLPAPVGALIKQCLSPMRSQRPENMAQVMKVVAAG